MTDKKTERVPSGHPTRCSRCGEDKIPNTHVCSVCKYGDHGMTQEEIGRFYQACRQHRKRTMGPLGWHHGGER